MKLALRTLHIRSNSALEQEIARRLAALDDPGHILSAHVLLSRSRGGPLPFRAAVQLVVPGPDLHAVAEDHTLAAALLKVERDLREQLAVRQCRRSRNRNLRMTRRMPPGRK